MAELLDTFALLRAQNLDDWRARGLTSERLGLGGTHLQLGAWSLEVTWPPLST